MRLHGTRRAPVLAFTPSELGLRDASHAAKLGLPCGRVVRIFPVLSTQGINEEQSLANLLRTHTAEQSQLNSRAIEQLSAYHEQRLALLSPAGVAATGVAATGVAAAGVAAAGVAAGLDGGGGSGGGGGGAGGGASASDAASSYSSLAAAAAATTTTRALQQRVRIGSLLSHARALLRSPPDAKNVDLLRTLSTLARLLGGGRLTLCASGRDRTLMSLTLEQGRLLTEHGLAEARWPAAVELLRRGGLSRECAARCSGGGFGGGGGGDGGGGERLYGFNGIQLSMLPEAYRPPDGTSRG